MMKSIEEQPERERRIFDDIVVDAYGETERAMSWCVHLEESLRWPFAAVCRMKRAASPLRVGERVTVEALAEEESQHEVFVFIRRGSDKLAVPLVQLKCHSDDEATRGAVADWHYWLARGYEY